MKETIALVASGVAVVLGTTAVIMELRNRKKIKEIEYEVRSFYEVDTEIAESTEEFCEEATNIPDDPDLDVVIPDEEDNEEL